MFAKKVIENRNELINLEKKKLENNNYLSNPYIDKVYRNSNLYGAFIIEEIELKDKIGSSIIDFGVAISRNKDLKITELYTEKDEERVKEIKQNHMADFFLNASSYDVIYSIKEDFEKELNELKVEKEKLLNDYKKKFDDFSFDAKYKMYKEYFREEYKDLRGKLKNNKEFDELDNIYNNIEKYNYARSTYENPIAKTKDEILKIKKIIEEKEKLKANKSIKNLFSNILFNSYSTEKDIETLSILENKLKKDVEEKDDFISKYKKDISVLKNDFIKVLYQNYIFMNEKLYNVYIQNLKNTKDEKMEREFSSFYNKLKQLEEKIGLKEACIEDALTKIKAINPYFEKDKNEREEYLKNISDKTNKARVVDTANYYASCLLAYEKANKAVNTLENRERLERAANKSNKSLEEMKDIYMEMFKQNIEKAKEFNEKYSHNIGRFTNIDFKNYDIEMIKTNLIRSSDSHYIKYKNEKIEEFIDCLKESKLPKLYIDIPKQELKFNEIIENYKKTTIANSKKNTNESILTNIKMELAINDKVNVEETKENLPMKRNKVEENQVGNINDVSLINFAEEDDNEDSIQNVFSIKKKSKLGLGFDNEK